MKMKLQKQEKGFTIIEVLIVLAIAGLIILIVFLAVPALQRNSRNTAIKADVQNLLGGISEYQSNNNGKVPTNISGTGDITLGQGSPGGPATAPTQKTTIQGSTTVNVGTTRPTEPLPGGEIRIVFGMRCDPAAGGASSRAFVAFFTTETSGGATTSCQES